MEYYQEDKSGRKVSESELNNTWRQVDRESEEACIDAKPVLQWKDKDTKKENPREGEEVHQVEYQQRKWMGNLQNTDNFKLETRWNCVQSDYGRWHHNECNWKGIEQC